MKKNFFRVENNFFRVAFQCKLTVRSFKELKLGTGVLDSFRIKLSLAENAYMRKNKMSEDTRKMCKYFHLPIPSHLPLKNYNYRDEGAVEIAFLNSNFYRKYYGGNDSDDHFPMGGTDESG